MLEFMIAARDMIMSCLLAWLGFGADASDASNGYINQVTPLIEIGYENCVDTELERVMDDASGV